MIVGNESLKSAIWIGNAIEDLDIDDLMTLLPQTDNRDIKTVYQNLMKGSRNHLRSFHAVLTGWKGSCTPLFLSPTVFKAIVTSKHETGGALDENGKLLP